MNMKKCMKKIQVIQINDGEMQDVREGIEPGAIDEGTYSKEALEQLIVEQIEDSIKKGKK
jgi:hypothetical protein